MRCRRSGSAFAAAVALTLCLPAFGSAALVDFLYIEPNEGGSSAGHVALAFGDRTYDFQRHPDGLLRLEREDSAEFRYRYAVLGNRTIHRARIAVSEDTRDLLVDGFRRRYVVAERHFARHDALVHERRVLQLLLHRVALPAGLPIPGAGYFLPREAAPPAEALLRLHARVVAGGALAARVDALDDALRALPLVVDEPPPTVDPDILAAEHAGFGEHYTDAMTAGVALALLRDPPALRADATFTTDADDRPLDTAERAALAAFGTRVEDGLVRLFASSRAATARPALVGMARLAAIARSLETGRLVVLDAFAPDARRVSTRRLRRDPALAAALVAEARAAVDAARAAFTAAHDDELDYAALESAANRLGELRRGLRGGDVIRVQRGSMVPSATAMRADLVVPDAAAESLAAALGKAEAAERTHARRLADVYGYDLVHRNCASEIFRTIDAALATPSADPTAASSSRLGGHVMPDRGLNFIPVVAAAAARRAWTVVAVDEIPSYRAYRLRGSDAGGSLVGALRESNTLTSSVYRRSDDDSVFLFFTDGVVAARPLLGAVNAAVGVGAGVLGVALLPIDRGETLSAAIRGIAFSIPELAFVNVRKGSFDYVERSRVAPLVEGD